jgi:hypothetical protein
VRRQCSEGREGREKRANGKQRTANKREQRGKRKQKRKDRGGVPGVSVIESLLYPLDLTIQLTSAREFFSHGFCRHHC